MNNNQNQWQSGNMNMNNGINNFNNGLMPIGNNIINSSALNSKSLINSNQFNFFNQNQIMNNQNSNNPNNNFQNMNNQLNMLNMNSMNPMNRNNQFMNNLGLLNMKSMGNMSNPIMLNNFMNSNLNMNNNNQNMSNQNINNFNMNNQKMNNQNINMNNMNNQNINNQNINNFNMNNQNMNNQFVNNQNINNFNMNNANSNVQNTNNLNMNMNNQNMINQVNNNMPQQNQNYNIAKIENKANNNFQCQICNKKAINPKKCKACNSIFCKECINKYLNKQQNHCICGNKASVQDLIDPSFQKNINTQLHQNNNQDKINNFQKDLNLNNNRWKFNQQNNNIRNNRMSLIKEEEENEINNDICPKHENKIDYYCVQCNKYYCSNCLLFFSEDVKVHEGHLIVQLTKFEDINVKKAIEEYKKLNNTKSTLEDFVGTCNMNLRENEIKKQQFSNSLDLIKNLYLKKIDEEADTLRDLIKNLKKQKELIEMKIGSIPNGFNNIINSNDYVQGGLISQELKNFNQIDRNIELKVNEIDKINPKLFIENFETDYLEFNIPNNGEFIEGQEIGNKNINIIPEFPGRIIIKYLQNKIYISFSIDINMPLNSRNYPKFYTYITLKNQKYGLEFSGLSDQLFPQDAPNRNQNNEIGRIRQQINSTEIDAKQFLFLAEMDNKIKMKLFITKAYFKI